MNTNTLDTASHKSKPAGWLFKGMMVGLTIWVSLLNWDMFRIGLGQSGIAFPELIALFGPLTLDMGAWNWKNVRSKWADSDEQEALALWMAWIDMILAVSAGIIHMAQIMNMMTLPSWTGYLITVILGAATALNVVAGFAFGMLDPEFQRKQRMRRIARIYRDRKDDNLEKLALSHADEDAAQAAQEIFAAERSAWQHAHTAKPGGRGGSTVDSTRKLNATIPREETPASFD